MMNERRLARALVPCILLCGVFVSPVADGKKRPASPGGLTRSNTGAPVLLSLRGPESPRPGSMIELVIEIRRAVPSDVPMRLSLLVPDGATLIEGAAAETIVDSGETLLLRHFRLQLSRLPVADMVATLDLRGANHGAHAVARYLFGRAPAMLPRPGHRPGITPRGGQSAPEDRPLNAPTNAPTNAPANTPVDTSTEINR